MEETDEPEEIDFEKKLRELRQVSKFLLYSIDDNSFSWGRPEKYDKIIHAEINALRHAMGDVSGTTLYVTGMPCKRCMLHIIESEIERVVYTNFESDQDSLLHNQEEKEATLDLVRLSGIRLDKFNGNLTIEEYRKLLHSDRLILVVDKPLTRTFPELHEDNDDFLFNNNDSNMLFINNNVSHQSKNDILTTNFNL